MNDRIQNFWEKFLDSLPPTERPKSYTAWAFGNTPEMEDELATLVLKGNKRATTSLAWIYEKFPNEKIPAVGEYSIVLNSLKEPVCVIKTISVVTCKFNQVDEDFARTEGEGDGSLEYWRDVHWNYFVGECKVIGREPSEEMPVICEIFELLYPTSKT